MHLTGNYVFINTVLIYETVGAAVLFHDFPQILLFES